MPDRSRVLCLRILCSDETAVVEWLEPVVAALGLRTFRAYGDSEEPVVDVFIDVDGRDVAVEVNGRIVAASLDSGSPGRASYVAVFRRASVT